MPDAHDRLVALLDPTRHPRLAALTRAIADALVDPANRAVVLEAMGAERFGPNSDEYMPIHYVFPTEEASDRQPIAWHQDHNGEWNEATNA